MSIRILNDWLRAHADDLVGAIAADPRGSQEVCDTAQILLDRLGPPEGAAEDLADAVDAFARSLLMWDVAQHYEDTLSMSRALLVLGTRGHADNPSLTEDRHLEYAALPVVLQRFVAAHKAAASSPGPSAAESAQAPVASPKEDPAR